MTDQTFRHRLQDTAQSAVLFAVRVTIIILIVGFALTWLLGDYAVTRQRSLNGQIAYEYIQKTVAAQQQQAQAPQPSLPPPPSIKK